MNKSQIFLNIVLLFMILIVFLTGCSISSRKNYKEICNIGIVDRIGFQIDTFKKETGRFPSDLNELKTDLQTKDAWGRELLYRAKNHSFILSSAGKDGIHGTKDDCVYQKSSGLQLPLGYVTVVDR